MTTQTEGVKAGHTPWSIVPANEYHGFYVENDVGRTVCDLYHINSQSLRHVGFDDAEKNARLIAAAPDLLEALIEMVRQENEYGEGTVHPTVLNDAQAAIAKALGQ